MCDWGISWEICFSTHSTSPHLARNSPASYTQITRSARISPASRTQIARNYTNVCPQKLFCVLENPCTQLARKRYPERCDRACRSCHEQTTCNNGSVHTREIVGHRAHIPCIFWPTEDHSWYSPVKMRTVINHLEFEKTCFLGLFPI